MKVQEQNQQEKERERQLEKLRKQVNMSTPQLYFWLTISGIGAVGAVLSLVKGTINILNIALLLFFMIHAISWLFRITDDSEEKETAQMSAGELALKFEEKKKFSVQLFTFISVGFLCYGVSTLIGAFDFSSDLGVLFVAFCIIAPPATVYDYWKNQKNEKMARQLAEQNDD